MRTQQDRRGKKRVRERIHISVSRLVSLSVRPLVFVFHVVSSLAYLSVLCPLSSLLCPVMQPGEFVREWGRPREVNDIKDYMLKQAASQVKAAAGKTKARG